MVVSYLEIGYYILGSFIFCSLFYCFISSSNIFISIFYSYVIYNNKFIIYLCYLFIYFYISTFTAYLFYAIILVLILISAIHHIKINAKS